MNNEKKCFVVRIPRNVVNPIPMTNDKTSIMQNVTSVPLLFYSAEITKHFNP